MDLLAPWKMCLQCLPVFASEPVLPPPPSQAAVPLHAASDKSKLHNGASTSTENLPENDLQEAEKPSFSDASLTHDPQHQDLPLFDYAKDVGSLVYAPAETSSATNGGAQHVDHDSNSVVFSNTVQAPQDDKAPPLHPTSDSISNEGHTDLPFSSSQSEGGGDDEEAHQHTHHQHSRKRNNYTSDDGFHAPPHPQSITSHVQGLQTTTLPMEKSQSTPADIKTTHDAYEDEDTAMNGSSSTLETSQTELIDGVETKRVRRRDQLKDQFKDFRNQLKQGRQHLKEGGSKHLQKMMSAMNKQA